MKKSTASAPPKTLSPAAASWWRRLNAEFDLTDEAAQFLLESALKAHDRMAEAAKLIDEHGVCIKDRYGQLKPNPAVTVERDARAAMLQAFKALNLDVLPPLKVGRPGGR